MTLHEAFLAGAKAAVELLCERKYDMLKNGQLDLQLFNLDIAAIVIPIEVCEAKPIDWSSNEKLVIQPRTTSVSVSTGFFPHLNGHTP